MSDELSRKAAIEALIFSARNGIEPRKIASIVGMKLNQVTLLLEEIESDYATSEHGVMIKSVNGKLRFYTKPELQNYVSQISTRPIVSITDTQMEALAIVAIKGPLTKNDVELIRGRSTQNQLLELSKMGLIGKRKSKLPGRPYLYKTTKKFYDLFQLEDLSEIVQGLSLGGGEEVETTGDTVPADGPVQEEIDTGDTGRQSQD
ncbi:MAG TPA: SMC-Scp complex subunit ScpB [Mesotoga infera]|nr:SMC-Scp complex subunit ScpB [Mesotoga infera]